MPHKFSETCHNAKRCLHFVKTPLSWDDGGIGKHLLAMAIYGVVFFGILMLLETGIGKRLWYRLKCNPIVIWPTNRYWDVDVENERSRIAQLSMKEKRYGGDLVTLDNLSKAYTVPCYCRRASPLAVAGLTVGIPRGECFGLLGVNGSGKTTTFKILTSELLPTFGTAYIAGHCVTKESKKVHRNIGYCSQFNAMLDYLTCKETLEMYARIAGIRQDSIRIEVDRLLQLLLMQDCSNKTVDTLSGGNSRKLNAAVAVIGDPSVILLDEPTTGLDPLARRQTWTLLAEYSMAGRTIVLTSHSMEECDALCTRLAIMVDGAFVCLGTPQYLKNKFSNSYCLKFKAYNEDPDTINNLKLFIAVKFPRCSLVDEHERHFTYNIPYECISWSKIFNNLEKAKSKKIIEDYSVSQTGLEDIYFNIARRSSEAINKSISTSTLDNLTMDSTESTQIDVINEDDA
ncbi:hypothetical protein LSAT2_015699 [Lamellibrachia satsuma]|nr:hypothetical protein LSAT2_015699 [Lamellibrachia satsuma]